MMVMTIMMRTTNDGGKDDTRNSSVAEKPHCATWKS